MKRYQCVLITGASSGIGAKLSRCLSPHAEKIVLVARRKDRLEELAVELKSRFGTEAIVVACDLSQDGAAEALWAEVISYTGAAPDLVVNNAGAGFCGEAYEIPVDSEKTMLALNVTAPMVLCKLALKVMSARRKGVIVNVASMGAFQPGPYMAAYYASKAFVLSYTEAIAEEARVYGVRAIAVCPGYTDTDFHELAGTSRNGVLAKIFRTSPSFVAASIADAILHGYPDVVIPGTPNNLCVLFERFLPRRLVARISGMLLKRR